jgi:hypothetical protein
MKSLPVKKVSFGLTLIAVSQSGVGVGDGVKVLVGVKVMVGV